MNYFLLSDILERIRYFLSAPSKKSLCYILMLSDILERIWYFLSAPSKKSLCYILMLSDILERIRNFLSAPSKKSLCYILMLLTSTRSHFGSDLHAKYLTSNTIYIIRLTHTNLWESMGKPCSCTQFIKNHNFYYKSHENLHQVLQVTRKKMSLQYTTIIYNTMDSRSLRESRHFLGDVTIPPLPPKGLEKDSCNDGIMNESKA